MEPNDPTNNEATNQTANDPWKEGMKEINNLSTNRKSPNLLSRFFSGLLRIYRTLRSVVFNLIFLLILLIVLSPLLPQPQLPVPENAALLLNPVGTLVEQKSIASAIDQLLQETGAAEEAGEVVLQDVLDAIDLAAEDSRITSMVITTDHFQGGGLSQLRDIAEALQTFRDSGKKIYAIGASYNQIQYYLASQADEILLNPLGAVELEGFGAWQLYYRAALDKLGVNTHIFRVGEYKAAVEPFERTNMSDAAKANYGQFLGELWDIYLADVGARRELSAEFINDYINRMDVHLTEHNGDSAELALASGFVDRVEARPATMSYLQESIGIDGDSFRNIGFQSYLARARKAQPPATTPNRIALIVASGEIQDGVATPGNIGSSTLADLIREARNDERLKALVLRIDSPGGSVSASEEIREELLAFKATGRPLVISMGSTAASGGYWISTPADEIWASPATITGSIGIFGVVPTIENTLDKIGISVDGVGTTDMSGAGTLVRPLSPLVERSVQAVIENGYARFLGLVADSRGMTTTDVDAIAQGQIWSGQTALAIGLVDQLGSLEAALDSAAKLAGLEEYETNMLEPHLSPLQQFIRQITESAVIKSLAVQWQEQLVPDANVRQTLKALRQGSGGLLLNSDPRAAYVHCLECSAINLW